MLTMFRPTVSPEESLKAYQLLEALRKGACCPLPARRDR